jgi:hypothetical protein
MRNKQFVGVAGIVLEPGLLQKLSYTKQLKNISVELVFIAIQKLPLHYLPFQVSQA